MPYILLGCSIILEIFASTLLKYSQGFTKLAPSCGCAILYILCFFLFSKALNHINLGIAYATWSAVGIVATSIISALVFSQKLSPLGLIGITLIITGCIILNLFGTTGH